MIRGKHALDGLDRDIREHIEHETQDNIDRGMTPEEARRHALLKFGNVALAREDTRAVWVWPRLDEMRQDIGYAFRTLRRNPGFAAVAVLTLALGIGATTAIFSVVYATLLKPLPYTNPDELVAMSVYIPQLQSKFPSMPVRPVDFEEFRQSNSVFSGMAAIRERDFNLTGGGEPERLYGARVSASLFPLLGVQPQLGRTFLAEEDTPGRDSVVLISHHLWTSRFGADPGDREPDTFAGRTTATSSSASCRLDFCFRPESSSTPTSSSAHASTCGSRWRSPQMSWPPRT